MVKHVAMQRLLTTLALTLFMVSARSAAANAQLAGKMAIYNFLIGGVWYCKDSISQIGSRPARVTLNRSTFEAVGPNVLHEHITWDQGAGDGYTSYDRKANAFWSSGADSDGVTRFLVSRDGKVFRGQLWGYGNTAKPWRVVSSDRWLDDSHKSGRIEIHTFKNETGIATASCQRKGNR